MPYDPEQEEDFLRVESDVLGSLEPKGPIAHGSPTGDVGSGSGPTVVALESDADLDLNDDMHPAPVADVDMEDEPVRPALSGPKKRGRPSRSASGTPVVSAKPARTPKSARATAKSTPISRKRKAPEAEPESENAEEDEEEEEEVEEDRPAPAKRGRPPRATSAAASARLAAKAAKKPTRGRPKGSTAATSAAKKPDGRGRPTNNGATPAGEYEVEKIVDSMIDADSMEHMYLIKWKGYGDNDNTWEPKTNLGHSSDLVKAFDAKKKPSGSNLTAAGKERKKPGRKPKAKA